MLRSGRRVICAVKAGTAGHSAADRPSLIPSWLQTRSARALPWVALALHAVGRRTVRQPVQNRLCDDRVAKDPPSPHPLSDVSMTVPLVEPAITQAVKIVGPRGPMSKKLVRRWPPPSAPDPLSLLWSAALSGQRSRDPRQHRAPSGNSQPARPAASARASCSFVTAPAIGVNRRR
jgi:hypothetical protein